MTFFVICDKCGRQKQCRMNPSREPINPLGWYSKNVGDTVHHACCREHIPNGELVSPLG